MEINSYFKNVNEDQKNLVFILNGMEYAFIGPNTKGAVTKSAIKIVAGLNHMFQWAYDNKKYDFINKLNIFFVELYNNIHNPSFRDKVVVDVKEGRFPNTQQATAYHYKKIIDNMDNQIYDGVVDYIANNIIENTDDTEDLSPEELFVVTCVFTITKLMIVGVSLLERFKLENYLYEPLIHSIDKFQDAMAMYYYNVKQDREKYYQIKSSDYKNSIYRFFYNELHKEFERNNVGLFRNNGYSIDRVANDHYITGLCTLSKCIPILIEARTSEQHTAETDYKKSKFINKNTIKYIKGVIHNMIGGKLGVTFGAVISVIKYERTEGDNRFENAMKQEVMLERRSISDMERRRKNIKLLKEYVKDMTVKYDLLKNSFPIIPTPLTDFFIIKLLGEISEDALTLKLLDKKTYYCLSLLIAYKLRERRWIGLADAVLSNQATPSDIAKYLDDKMDNISKLRKYHTNPPKCLENIKKIVGLDYKNTSKNSIIHIGNEFIQFLLNDQIDKFIFINDAYIYDYEDRIKE